MHAQLGVLLELPRRHELGMNDHRAVVLLGLEPGAATGLDHQVDGGIAIAVGKQLNALTREPRHRLHELIRRKHRLTAPVGLAIGAGGQQRLAPEGGLALG